MTLLPGTTLGRYQILEPLGQGGMATVYKAFQPSLEREVALKVLRPGFAQDQEFRERFEREAKSIARLRHPNIVQVFDFEVAQSGEFVLAMEYLEGGTLKDRTAELASKGRGLDPAETVRILWEVADALSFAHDQGIVHRDVKPSNVMLARPRDRAVVTDFGIARILGATSHTQTGVGIGTPEYMAPEQGQGGKVDHRADIYSLGAMAYELLVGRVPYSAETPLAVVIAHIKDPLPLPSQVNPTIGAATERALLRALAKDPAARYDSALAFAEALKAGMAEDSAGGTVPTVVVRGAADVRRTQAPVKTSAATSSGVTAGPAISFTVPAVLSQRPVLSGIAAVAVLAIVLGGVAVAGAFRTPATAPTASGAPSVQTAAVSSLPPLTGIPKGRLVYEAKFKPDETNFLLEQHPPNSQATVANGALDLESHINAVAGVTFPVSLKTYVAEIGLGHASTNGHGPFRFVLRESPTEQILFLWEPTTGDMEFQKVGQGKIDDLAPRNPGGAQCCGGGATRLFTAVVEQDRYTIFLEDKQLGQFVDASLSAPTTPRAWVTAAMGGTIVIDTVRFYEVAAAQQ